MHIAHFAFYNFVVRHTQVVIYYSLHLVCRVAFRYYSVHDRRINKYARIQRYALPAVGIAAFVNFFDVEINFVLDLAQPYALFDADGFFVAVVPNHILLFPALINSSLVDTVS